MNLTIESILNRHIKQENEPIRILTFPTHETAETIWCQNNIEVWAMRGPNIKDWNSKFRPLPKNYFLLAKGNSAEEIINIIPSHKTFDCVVSQNIFAHHDLGRHVANFLHIPLIELQHVLPDPSWTPGFLKQFREKKAEKTVFITEFSRDRWGYSEENSTVIHHAVDTNLFCPDPNKERRAHILSVVNEFAQRDYQLGFKLWENIVKDLPHKHVGSDPSGIFFPANDLYDLINYYQTAQIFINTSLISPIPCALLEAAACGCAIVTTNTCAIPTFFEHEKNCLMSDKPEDLRKFCKHLLQNEQERNRLGLAAREMILEKCNIDRYIKDWTNVFREVCYEN